MNGPPTPLLRRSPLLPGESLPSFLIRLAKLNYYDPPSIMEGLCLTYWNGRDQAARPLSVETFERMTVLTGTDPLALYAATVHRFAPILTSPNRPTESLKLSEDAVAPCLVMTNLSQHLRPDSAAQFCPDCLQSAPYHRLAWMPVAVSACLKHQRVLIDQCPRCRDPLSIRAVVDARCGTCEADLRQARVIPIGQDTLGLLSQQAIQSWLMGEQPSGFHSTGPLPEQPPAVLYHFVDELRLSLKNVQTGWKHMHKIVRGPRRLVFPGREARRLLSPDQSYRLFATAFKSLLNWPEGFYEFLRALGNHGGRRVPGEWHPDPDLIHLQRLEKKWQHPNFQFIREAFEEYLVDRYAGAEHVVSPRWYRGRPARTERYLYATIAETAQLLHLSSEMVQRLAELGHLRLLEPQSTSGQGGQFVRRTEVLALRRKWSEAIALYEAGWWVGFPVEITWDLAKAGVLVAERGLDGDDRSDCMISKQSIVDLWSAVIAEARVMTNPLQQLIDLRTAAQMLDAVGLKTAYLIQRVATGELRAYRSMPVSPLLEALLFSQQEIKVMFGTRRGKRRGKSARTNHPSGQ